MALALGITRGVWSASDVTDSLTPSDDGLRAASKAAMLLAMRAGHAATLVPASHDFFL